MGKQNSQSEDKDRYFLVSEDNLSEMGSEDGDTKEGMMQILEGMSFEDISSSNLVVIKGRVIPLKMSLDLEDGN